ncbi:unnamed protein product [Sphenostylis stenocarpa]|uniref:Response regulatory domain-containing protein n=1 Tax=Sphenostylis stenocarpa TaxID=92480 RepID=A0AA86V617_9FABA|nr:unnamed protein product [Sphenostylis stenocarpa]
MAKISSDQEEKGLQRIPPSLRVLAIDTDPTVLDFIKKTCNQYGYQVITCSESVIAANVLRESKGRIDLILIEVHMPIMDGYQFLQFVNQEIYVPVILMSSDDSQSSAYKAFELGACDYSVKPLNEKELKNMWKHVYRKSIRETKQKDIGSLEDDNQKRGINDNSEFVSSSVIERTNSNIREFDNVGESENRDEPPKKKPRLVWSTELHLAFVKAVNQIGHAIFVFFLNCYLLEAVPNKILELMNVHGLTRNNVASHLQTNSDTVRQRHPRQPQNEMQGTIEPRVGAYGRIHLQPFSATVNVTNETLADLHPGLTGNMVLPKRDHQSAPNMQLAKHFDAESVLGLAQHSHPLSTCPNMTILQNFPESMGTLDVAFRYGVWSPSNTVLAENHQTMVQRNSVSVDTLQQPVMHHQIHPINLQASSMMFSGNSASVNQNGTLGWNMDHTST